MSTRRELESSGSFRASLANAVRYWEPRRVHYNLVLSVVAMIWVVVSWPHFRPAFRLESLLLIAVLAMLANLCYSAAYLADILLQRSGFSAAWSRRRAALWWAGTLFAVLLENYWIADEIYPFV